jgi:hypothetical protein
MGGMATMRGLRLAVTLGACLATVPPAAGQSLADVARTAEAERGAAARRPPAKIYTNKDLPTPARPPATTAAIPPPAAHAPATAVEPAAAPAASPAATATARDEAYWRERMRPLRERLDDARAQADETLRRADALLRAADRCFQIGIVCQDYTESVRLRDAHKTLLAEVARAGRDVAALEDEARRAGVPPGWLRP